MGNQYSLSIYCSTQTEITIPLSTKRLGAGGGEGSNKQE